MKSQPFLVTLIVSIFFSCSNEEITESIIKQRLAEINQLGTVEYDLSKVLIVDDEQWYTYGDRKALINLEASLVAGIDFKKIEISNLVSNNSIDLKLPEPEIIFLNIPPEKVSYEVLKVDKMEVNALTFVSPLITLAGMRSDFSNEELNQIQIMGEEDIRKKIDELGILKEATQNSKSFLNNWFKLLGFKTINYLSYEQKK